MDKLGVLLILLHVVCIRADCDYSRFFLDFSGLKLSSIPNGKVIGNRQRTVIPNDRSVVLYCAAGFEWDYIPLPPHNSWGAVENREITDEIGTSITIMCDTENQMRFLIKNGIILNESRLIPEHRIKCKESSLFYTSKLDHCDYQGLRLGINLKDIPIVSLELCHDYDNSEPIFTHYIAAQRSIILERQIEYNPSNVTKADLNSGLMLNIEDEIPPAIELKNDYSLFVPSTKHLLFEIDYNYNELTSSTLYSSLHVDALKYKFNTLNSVPWWTPLRAGNWQAFENILSRQLEKGSSYRIYTGKSHIAHFPEEFVCNSETEMIYDFNERKKHIPLYIWNYIIPRNEDNSTEEFVLLAINSPFVEANNITSWTICEDICDRISWLKPLQATRKITSFGYMFCCKPKDVYHLLDGFPLKNKSFILSNNTSRHDFWF